MENKKETAILGSIGTTIRIRSFIPIQRAHNTLIKEYTINGTKAY